MFYIVKLNIRVWPQHQLCGTYCWRPSVDKALYCLCNTVIRFTCVCTASSFLFYMLEISTNSYSINLPLPRQQGAGKVTKQTRERWFYFQDADSFICVLHFVWLTVTCLTFIWLFLMTELCREVWDLLAQLKTENKEIRNNKSMHGLTLKCV